MTSGCKALRMSSSLMVGSSSSSSLELDVSDCSIVSTGRFLEILLRLIEEEGFVVEAEVSIA